MKWSEANAKRLCLECGAPDAHLFVTTRGANPGRKVRLCTTCLLQCDDWLEFGLVEREPMPSEIAVKRLAQGVLL